ncbi:MAG: hypothetical protein SNF93_01485 [Rikenellaceae bacterium]
MKQRKCYRVADHTFALTIDIELLEALQLKAFAPFEIEQNTSTLFEIEVVDNIADQIVEPVIVDAPLSSSGMPKVDIYRLAEGYLYNITMPRCREINASLAINQKSRRAEIKLDGSAINMLSGLNNALILSYITFTMEHKTLLLHASTVMLEGKAYLFLGKSGTGKSTHSRMWLESFPQAELLNDDHPIVRAFDDGSIIVYGSPWSGKTPCYRNLSSPMGGIVRIERALTNQAERLRPLKAYASITTSCSGAQWSKSLMESKVKTVEAIASGSPCYVMRCLPNHDAAHVCYNFIKNDE